MNSKKYYVEINGVIKSRKINKEAAEAKALYFANQGLTGVTVYDIESSKNYIPKSLQIKLEIV